MHHCAVSLFWEMSGNLFFHWITDLTKDVVHKTLLLPIHSVAMNLPHMGLCVMNGGSAGLQPVDFCFRHQSLQSVECAYFKRSIKGAILLESHAFILYVLERIASCDQRRHLSCDKKDWNWETLFWKLNIKTWGWVQSNWEPFLGEG